MSSRLFKLFVEAMRSGEEGNKSIERWKKPGKTADLGVRILSEVTRTSLTTHTSKIGNSKQ